MAPIETEILFIAGFGPIDRDVAVGRALYSDSLGIAFKEETGGYLHTGALQGAKHFALWPLAQAAQSCFGTDSWPALHSRPLFEIKRNQVGFPRNQSRGMPRQAGAAEERAFCAMP